MQAAPAPDARHLPFGEALDPFAAEAWERLSGTTPLAAALLTDSARARLDWSLRGWLAAVSGKVLTHEFALFRLDRRSPLEAALGGAGGATSDLYRAFVGHLAAGDWGAVRLEYPEWGRLRDVVVDHWVESTAELLERLALDREAIGRVFAAGANVGRVASVRPLTDDRHDGGRLVQAILFEDGTRIVYKPRPVGIEAWFGDLISSLVDGVPSLPGLRTPAILDRGAYGWSEFLPARGCDSPEGVARFFQRSGALLAVFHALGAVDCHLENLIAHGEHPVLVDAETVLQADPRPWRSVPDRPPHDSAADVAGVLETGFLPNPIRAEGPDTSGLDGGRTPRAVEGALVWEAVNTDGMALRAATVDSPAADNVVRLGGAGVDPRAHEAELLAGFEAMYAHLVEARGQLLESSLWRSAPGRRIRFLARSTSVYWLLALSSLEPRFMTAESARRRELERLFAPLDDCADPARLRPLLEAEVEALDRLDVPAFYIAADGKDLELPTGSVADFFQESGLERAERRLRGLGPEDLARQRELIRESLGGAA